MTVAGAGGGAHILVFPYPARGHLIPLLDLTSQLVRHGLAITLLVTPKNLAFLNPLCSRHPAIKTLVLPFPEYASLPAGVENVQHLPAGSFRMMFHALGGLYDPLLRWFHAQPSPPVAIISDIFLGWTQHLASKLGIRRVVFSPSGAMAVAVMNSLWRDLPKGEDPNDDNALIHFPEIPNSPVYPWRQVSPLYRSYVEGDPVSEFLKDGFRANVASWGLVVNSFSGLEPAYLAHVKKELGHNRVWAVGPLLPSDDDQSGPTERGGSSSVWPIDILSWLDKSQDDSVVYVCFGSQAVLTNGQMEALALGLEKSGARFLWCVKEPTEGHVAGMYGAIPSSFEDRVAGRGLVVRGWAPQVLILRHRAIGAFLTHCGWNSVLEAIYAGVPMLAWPMTADQFVDATLLVDELKVARTVCEGAGVVPNSDELARCLAEAVGEKREERVRSAKLREAALEAMKDGGSSSKDLVDLVTLLPDGAVNWSSRSMATPTG